MNNKKVVGEVKAILNKYYPYLGPNGYYLNFVDNMIDYLAELNERESRPDKMVLTWTYPETIQVETLNDAADRIKYHLIDCGENYIWQGVDDPKNDYERGVYNAMRFLHAIVHWTNPS